MDETLKYVVMLFRTYLKLFEIDDNTALDLFREMRDDLYDYLKASGRTKGDVGKLYRKKKLIIKGAFEANSLILTSFKKSSELLTKELINLNVRGELSNSLGSIIRSLLHMSINRLMHSFSQQQEVVYYDLYFRYLLEQKARSVNSHDTSQSSSNLLQR